VQNGYRRESTGGTCVGLRDVVTYLDRSSGNDTINYVCCLAMYAASINVIKLHVYK
jgi:hypothetical protein